MKRLLLRPETPTARWHVENYQGDYVSGPTLPVLSIFPSFSFPDVLCDTADPIWRKGTPFKAMTGRTTTSPGGLPLRFSGVFLSCTDTKLKICSFERTVCALYYCLNDIFLGSVLRSYYLINFSGFSTSHAVACGKKIQRYKEHSAHHLRITLMTKKLI